VLARATRVGAALLATLAVTLSGTSLPALAASAPPGANLQLVSAYQGLIDTQDGSTWTGPNNAPFAEPTIARGANGDQLQLAANWNFGRLFNPANGTDHYGNFNDRLGDWVGGALPQDQGFGLNEPQLLHDFDNRGLDRYLLVAAATSWSTQQSKIAIEANKYLGDVDYGNTCVQALDANYLPGADPTNYYVDELRVGNDDNAVVIVGNMYGFDDHQFKYSKAWVIDKSELYNGYLQDCPLVSHQYILWGLTNPDGTPAVAMVPAHSYVSGDVADVVNAEAAGDNGASTLTLWHINTQNVLQGAVNFNSMTVSTNAYFDPPTAEQAGTSVQINVYDSRLYNAVVQPGALWTVHSVACVGSSDPNTEISCLDWLEIDTNSGTVLQEGLYGYDGVYAFAPSITADADGNAVLAFEASAVYAEVGVYFTGRQASDAPNTLRDLSLLRDGEGCYEREPWNTIGLHSAVDYDPRDGGLFWVDGAYTSGTNPNCQSNDWATEYGAVTFSGATSGAQPATSASRQAPGASVASGANATGRCSTAVASPKPGVAAAHHPVCAVGQHSLNGKVHRLAKGTRHLEQHSGPIGTRSNPGAPVVHRRT
jgi:hypothetical protein